MTEKITLITPTGNRPEAFALLEKHMSLQVFTGKYEFEWLVVDDGTPAVKVTRGQKYLRGPKEWADGINTQRLNLDAVIGQVTGDYVFIIEDDDYYSPRYLQTMINLLQTVSAVGLSRAKYYNVALPGSVVLPNEKHAALSQTAFKRNLLPLFEKAVNSGEYYIDSEFWDRVMKGNISHIFLGNTELSIGMKGMPGREGLGAGHTIRGYQIDRDKSRLREWLGSAAELYVPYLREIKDVVLPEQRTKQAVQPRLLASVPTGAVTNRSSQSNVPSSGGQLTRVAPAVPRNEPVLDKLGTGEPVGDKGNMSGRQIPGHIHGPGFGGSK